MTNQEKWVQIIKDVASEQNYEIENTENQKFYIFIDRWNAVAFQIWNNKSSGYIEIAQWEGSSEDDATYGRGVYSLRCFTDVTHFCNILISSAEIRARRKRTK
jgi:hypothetical protein